MVIERQQAAIDTRLADFIEQHQPLFVLTGAGCSTASGIPDYRDEQGEWKHRKPVQYQDFCDHAFTRKRYWARSMRGWPYIDKARPTNAHLALTRLENAGLIQHLITQNVDRLHQKAGTTRVLELHGNLATVRCLACSHRFSRRTLQTLLQAANPQFGHICTEIAPDGDALIESVDFSAFTVIPCPECGSILKPDVVFFGESIPVDRVSLARQQLYAASAMLVIGSSLTVFSGYRFCRDATKSARPICAVNIGRTRADNELTLKIVHDCGAALDHAIKQLGL